jgi:purine nucleosidase
MASLPILFDVDTGVDDSLALLLALRHPAVEVVAIGTVAGNVNVDRCTINTLKVLTLAGRPAVPVARGCEKPLLQPLEDAATVHGNDGLGNSGYPEPTLRPTGEHAVDQMIRLAESRPGELTLLAVGPLTNVAVALMRQPRLPALFKRLVVMGGAFTHAGNTTPLAEFNIFVDPEAARMVFEAGFELTIVPLDATMQTLLDEGHLAQLDDSPVAEFVRRVTANYLERSFQRRGRRAAAMHDPLATAIAIDAAIMAESGQHYVTVETDGQWTRGMTIADRRVGDWPNRPAGRATICFRPDSERFFAMLVPTLRG